MDPLAITYGIIAIIGAILLGKEYWDEYAEKKRRQRKVSSKKTWQG